MNKALIVAIANLAAFLELSDDDVVDPDAAVQQLEDLGATLKELHSAELRILCRSLSEYADEERERGASPERVGVLRGLAEHLGLRDEE